MLPAPHDTLAYQLLLQDVNWVSQSHGEPGFRAYGFLADRSLSAARQYDAIQRAYTTFVTYDPRPPVKVKELGGKPEYPRSLALCHQHDLSYLNATPAFVREALLRYFVAALPGRGFPVTMTDDEDEGFSYTIDETALTRFAAQCADHFMVHSIEVRCFLAEPDTYSLAEHGAHMGREEPSNRVEALADSVS